MRKLGKDELKLLGEDLPSAEEECFLLTGEDMRLLCERSALSGLPGNSEIAKKIAESFLDNSSSNIIAYLDLSGFKAYNDNYGFIRGDEVLKALASKFAELNPGFSGHIGGDDFVAIMPVEDFDPFARELLYFFDNQLKEFYDPLDFEKGCIISFDRQGNRNVFPLMGCTIVAFQNRGDFSIPDEVGEYAARLKSVASHKADYRVGNSVVFKAEGKRITPLREMILDRAIPLNTRRGIIESLGEMKDHSYLNAIYAVLADGESEMLLQKSALYALGKFRLTDTIPKIEKFLNHSSAHLRMRAVEALGELGVAGENIEENGIGQAFNDKNYYVRRAAVLAAGRTSDSRFITPLRQKLKNDPDLKAPVFISLAMLEDEDVMKRLAYFAKSAEVERELRGWALRIYTNSGRPLPREDVEVIMGSLREEPADFIVEVMALFAKSLESTAASELFNSREINYLLGFSNHESWRVRRGVCEFASSIGSLNGGSREDESNWAGNSLQGNIGETVQKLCYDQSLSVRVKAIETLASVSDKHALLLRFFKDPEPAVRAAAVSAVEQMRIPPERKPEIIEKLRLRLKDSSHEVTSRAASSILALLRDPE